MSSDVQSKASSALWYKDAIIYELHVKTFHDSNGDGIGDFRGLIEKLDYLHELGVTAIWLLPFYPSPLRDDGYDIADYYDVNPHFGTLEDFQAFLAAAHARGLQVYHGVGDQPYLRSKSVVSKIAPRGTRFARARDVCLERFARKIQRRAHHLSRTSRPRIGPGILLAKAYYWHRFYSHQPDLNFDNPAVHEEVQKVLDFWLDMGVDGLRLDAVPYLI